MCLRISSFRFSTGEQWPSGALAGSAGAGLRRGAAFFAAGAFPAAGALA